METILADILAPGGLDDWHYHAAIRLVLAAILGGILGIERELRGRSAGFRTLILVCLGSATAMIVSLHFGRLYATADPGRVAYGVMTGVGFLGAGSILRDRGHIRGLTTAASLWCTAAIGLATGFGMFIEAGTATAITLICLWWFRPVDRRLPHRRAVVIRARFDLAGASHEPALLENIESLAREVRTVSLRRDAKAGIETIRIEAEIRRGRRISDIAGRASEMDGIREIRVE